MRPAIAAVVLIGSLGSGGIAGAWADAPPRERPAPYFALPAVDDGRMVESDTLFESNTATLVAFWTTECAECARRLEVCQSLDDWGREDGLRVVGVNFDESPGARMAGLIRQRTPRMMQLRDPQGRAAARYGAGAHSFSACLVDAEGFLRETLYDIPADSLARFRPVIASVMREALEEGGETQAPAEEGSEQAGERAQVEASEQARGEEGEPASGEAGERRRGALANLDEDLFEKLGLRGARLEVHGAGRVRWMDIDTTGVGATGPFGEAVDPGSSFRRRLELELTYAVSSHVRAGGLLWLSNEGEAVLRSGPDYLSSPWGSAFLRHETTARLGGLGRLTSALRAGYYEAFFTPLTLMRWDQDDSPISGGQRVQGCGICGGEAGLAGFIRSESLERLAPEYTFEGARWDASLGEIDLPFELGVDLTALYARPRGHWPEKESDFNPADLTALQFRQELYGGRLANHFSLPWSADLATLAGILLFVSDDRDDWPWDLWPPYAPGTDRLAALHLRLPLPARIEADAELVQSRWDARETPRFPEDDSALEANAFRAQASVDLRPRGGSAPQDVLPEGMTAIVQAGYQHTGADFFSPYSALSYETNVHPSQSAPLTGLAGPRVSGRVEWGVFGLGAFWKTLQPVDEEAESVTAFAQGDRRMASVWADVEAWPGGIVTLGWVKDDRDPLAPEERRRTWVVSVQQDLAARAFLFVEAQWLQGEREGNDVPAAEEEYSSQTVRVMMDVEF